QRVGSIVRRVNNAYYALVNQTSSSLPYSYKQQQYQLSSRQSSSITFKRVHLLLSTLSKGSLFDTLHDNLPRYDYPK
ncbi:hypothetical protein GGI21_006781, partial [Coemansia aciculifera]